MEDKDVGAGERFFLHMNLNNPDPESYDADCYVLLGFSGSYWSWPSWSDVTHKLDFQNYTCLASTQQAVSILDFTWPNGAGSAENLEFIGALFEESTWNLIGDAQYFTWQYH